jgi:hypothetical protein
MTEEMSRPAPLDGLRRRAEDAAQELAVGMPDNLDALSPEDARKVLHELRVHQIELEMQNEELRRVQEELEASRARYSWRPISPSPPCSGGVGALCSGSR